MKNVSDLYADWDAFFFFFKPTLPKHTYIDTANTGGLRSPVAMETSHVISHLACDQSGASWLSGSMRNLQREIMGSITGWAELCRDMLLGKALCPHLHSLNPGVSGYLVGQWRILCVWIVPCAGNGSQAVCSPGELRWLLIWMNRSCDQGVVVCSWASGASHQIPDHNPPPLPFYFLDTV